MLTGLFVDGAAVSPDSYAMVRGQSVVDLVRNDLETLEQNDMSMADRQKLEAWKNLLDETGRAVVSAECNSDVAAALGLTEANFGTARAPDGDLLTTKVSGALDVADLYSNIAVLSALCDHDRVILLKYPNNYIFEGLGITLDNESLSGRLDNGSLQGTCVPGGLSP